MASASVDAEPVKAENVEIVKLGNSNVEVPIIGIGAWSWGDKFYWNDGNWNGNFLVRPNFTWNFQ